MKVKIADNQVFCTFSLQKTEQLTINDNKLSHLDPIGIKPSSELIAAFYHFIKFDYAWYLIVFVYLFEEAAHVLTAVASSETAGSV